MKEIGNNVYYVGINDNDIDLFENVYSVPEGVSYNSYLIMDEKVTLLDTVDVRKSDEWLKKIDESLNGKKIDYLVVSHVEPDHSSNIQAITEKYPDVTLVGNQKTFQFLSQFFNINSNIKKQEVKEGDVLDIGSHKLQFFMAPMVHWPEVMFTYEETEKVLFSADGFGKFGALDTDEDWACEARRYYFNICGKYGAQVQNLLKKASALDIKTICPLHGPILKENLSYYIGLYDIWSKYEVETDGVFIAYASIHGNTKNAVLKLYDILKEKTDKKIAISDLSRSDMAENIEDAFRYSKMIIAAPTYDGGVFPVMNDFLHHLKIKSYKNRKVGVIENGSWAPMSGKVMKEYLAGMNNIEVCNTTVSIRSVMNDDNLTQMQQLADEILK